MKHITVLGIDLSKEIFELCGLDEQGNKIYKKRVNRKDFVATVIQLKTDLIAMEACGGSNHWCRVFKGYGKQVKLINAQYVKPFVKRNKNDENDAEAIAEAASRGGMYFVTPKTLEQQDIQSLLRIRERIKTNRVQLINEIRGLLQEYGITIPVGASKVYKEIPNILENLQGKLTLIMSKALNQMYVELKNMDEEMAFYNHELHALFLVSEDAKRLETIPGIGELGALGIVSLVGDVKSFKNGRHLSAYLGLVPRQHSSGGKEKLLGISKRGNVFVRTCLIHGARSVLRYVDKKTSKKALYLRSLKERRGMNRACVALANKNARIIWALLSKQENYNEQLAFAA